MDSSFLLILVVCSIGSVAFGQTCNDPVDIIIVADGSQSIGVNPFNDLKNNLRTFGTTLNVSDTGAKVGFVLYSTRVETNGIIRITGDATTLSSGISGLPYPEGGTNTHLGIAEATRMFNEQGRPNVRRVMLVITDGFSDNSTLTLESATKAKNESIDVFAVGVGTGVSNTELQNIASSSDNVKNADNFQDLINTLTALTQSICATEAPVGVLTCNNCLMESGAGFVPHPTECRMFIQCIQEPDRITSHPQDCPERLFWRQSPMGCVEFYESDCATKGQCIGAGNSFLFRSIVNCGLYYTCSENQVSQHCCAAPNNNFNDVTKRCELSTQCTQSCNIDQPNDIAGKCHNDTYRPFIDTNGQVDLCRYRAVVGPTTFNMACGAGTIFNPDTCSCSIMSNQCLQPVLQRAVVECDPDFYMPFDNDLVKDLQNGAWVGRVGVQIGNEEATFDGQGKSRLYINRYSGNDFALPLIIKVVFSDTASISNMAVLSTGGCLDRPSVYITAGNGQVTLGVVTQNQGYSQPIIISAAISNTNTYKEVKYMFDGTKLTGQVQNLDNNLNSTGSPFVLPTVLVPGGNNDRILLVSGSLQLGHAEDIRMPGFQGKITELKIWKGCQDKVTLDQYS